MKINRLPRDSGQSLIRCLGALVLLLLTACSNSNDSNTVAIDEPVQPTGLTGCADTDSCFSNPNLQIGGERVAQVQIPSDYTTTTRYPLVILLHGFGANGYIQSLYLGLNTRVDGKQYVLVVPDGTPNREGQRFWNATPACCAFSDEDQQVDDVAYIRGLIEEAAATYSIDPGRIGLIGHSNGGFMALRMVCEASDLVTSVVSLAGSTFADDASCAPADHPVSILALHGEADATIFYDGRQGAAIAYPGARETISRFAKRAHCDTENPVMAPNLDLVGNLDGAETTVLDYRDCADGVDVSLRTIVGGPHIPAPWLPSAPDMMVDWVVDHQRK